MLQRASAAAAVQNDPRCITFCLLMPLCLHMTHQLALNEENTAPHGKPSPASITCAAAAAAANAEASWYVVVGVGGGPPSTGNMLRSLSAVRMLL
jgi:hypothetical protein